MGNYGYLYKWIFREAATFGLEADLHGEILNRTVAADTCEVCARQTEQGPGTYTAAGDQRFGTLVAPQMLGVYHQHWINLRVDFDIDSPVNAARECNVCFPQPNLDDLQSSVALGVEPPPQAPGRTGGQYPVDVPGRAVRRAVVVHATTRLDHALRSRAALYIAGRYPNQAPAGYEDGLLGYAQDDESFYEQDVVFWYSLGFTHVTRPEDYPDHAGGPGVGEFRAEGVLPTFARARPRHAGGQPLTRPAVRPAGGAGTIGNA